MTNQESNTLINELLKCNCNSCFHFVRDLEKFKQAEFKDQFFGKCAAKNLDLKFDPLSWMDDKNADCYLHRRRKINYSKDGFPNE